MKNGMFVALFAGAMLAAASVLLVAGAILVTRQIVQDQIGRAHV